MRRRFVVVIAVGTAVNATLVAVLGFKGHHDGCDVSARGLIAWSQSDHSWMIQQERWVTVEPIPEDADRPPCRLNKKPEYGDYRPV